MRGARIFADMRLELTVDQLLSRYDQWTILDVRSPGEFATGHLPGAINVPLFDDTERARVGTAYKQQSPAAAMQEGLRIAGPHMAGYVEKAREAVRAGEGRDVVVHCWRGGKRSEAMAWLFNFAGLPVRRLKGGYKAFRQEAHACFADPRYVFRIIGGYTGAGKTEIIHALRGLGEQVIDLEGLACHKGSAFGNIGEAPQPTNEQFENELFFRLRAMDTTRPIWIENESKNVGRVYLPEAFWNRMRASILYAIEVSRDVRLDRVIGYYAEGDHVDALVESFGKIKKRLGGLEYQNAIDALGQGNIREAACLALAYYDKSYAYQLSQWPAERLVKMPPCDDVSAIARLLQSMD